MSPATRLQSDSSPTARGFVGWVGLAVVGLLGLLMAHHPMLFCGLARMQGSEDSRLINYLLEHSYRWIKQEPLHREFWDIPIFYPTRNTAGFSDTLLTIAPLYWGWRATGLAPDTAFQLWMLTISALNFLGGYWLLRAGFRRSAAGSIAGAFLFAFAAPRVNQIEHQQLMPQIFIVGTIMALFAIFRGRPSTRGPLTPLVLWLTAGLCLVAQFYTSVYLGWFFALALVLAFAWALFLPWYRLHLIGVIREQWMAIGLGTVLSALAIRPLLNHYVMAMSEVGMPDYQAMVAASVPDWRACVYMGPGSWIWGWMPRLRLFHLLGLEQAMRSGLGLVTPLFCLAGLVSCRELPAVRLTGLATVAFVLAIMRFERSIVEVVALGLWATCVLELYRGVYSRSERRILVVFGFLLTLTIFPGALLAVPLFLVVLVVLTSLLPPGRVRELGGVSILVALVGYMGLVSHVHRLAALGAGAALAAMLEIVGYRARSTRIIGTLVWGGSVVCAALWLFPYEIKLWPSLSAAIPGGRALRVVSRSLLLGLVPASLGLACFFESIEKWRMPRVLVYAFGLVCLLDQGVTTSSFDKPSQRAVVAALARRVDRTCRSFYYSPRNAGSNILHCHLDAMWAEIETGVPTVNGYSGATPPGWSPLYWASVDSSKDVDRIDSALAAWATLQRIPRDDICWIREEILDTPAQALLGETPRWPPE
jgi:hypothetical protein